MAVADATLVGRDADADQLNRRRQRRAAGKRFRHPRRSLTTERGQVISNVIAEPLQRMIPPVPGFLQALRPKCPRHGLLLVCDETAAGFRLRLSNPCCAKQRITARRPNPLLTRSGYRFAPRPLAQVGTLRIL